MFTGLIEATGTIVSLTPTGGAMRLVIAAPTLAGRWRSGDSIAVSGVCLTAIPVDDSSRFAADLAAETLARTTLGSLQTGSVVNLELPTPAGSPLGGHVVQGHVDAVGTLISLLPLHPADLDTTDWRLTASIPPELTPHVVQQGSPAQPSKSPSSPTPTNPPTSTRSLPAAQSTSKPTCSLSTPPSAPRRSKNG
jgi:riboflavin synthase